ncbi:MAG: hypothetical protein GY820_24190 [Gammaproteobacteria bacterium]|nr:hypothetical protein [Gammaproteobacteria bacterium]
MLLGKILARMDTLYNVHKISKLILVHQKWQSIYDEIINGLDPETQVMTFEGLQPKVFAKETLQQCGDGLTVMVIDDMAPVIMSKKFDSELINLVTVNLHHDKIHLQLLLQISTFKNALSVIFNNARYIYIPLFATKPATSLSLNLQVKKENA